MGLKKGKIAKRISAMFRATNSAEEQPDISVDTDRMGLSDTDDGGDKPAVGGTSSEETADILCEPTENAQNTDNTQIQEDSENIFDICQNEPIDNKIEINTPLEGVDQEKLHYVVASDDTRCSLLEQCRAAGAVASAFFPERLSAEAEPRANGERTAFLFDIINCRFSHFEGDGQSMRMPVYVCIDDKEPSLCHPHGIYRGTLIDSYELFQEKRVETNWLRHNILSRSLEEIIGDTVTADGCRFMCLMPDIVDAFDNVFRSQLKYRKTPLFQVPRSIALAYTLKVEGWELPQEFLCLDYDGEELVAIKVCYIPTENGEPVFVRMGREKIDGQHPSGRSLAESYLRRYQEKYQIHLSERTVLNLLNTRVLQHLLFENAPYLLIHNDGNTVVLRPDSDILEETAEEVYQDMEQIESERQMTVYAMCALFNDPQGDLHNITELEKGCIEICSKAERGETLWQEYLPDLKLEVNRNGCFDYLQLIGEEHRHQNINAFILNEKINIPVVDGTVTFPANGQKYYDLPLIREVFGQHSKEKMARFILDEPLPQDIQVELSVNYQYGDIDSYQLVAYSRELDFTINSEWCDVDSLHLSNPAPAFCGVEKHTSSPETIYRAFLEISRKLRCPERPYRLIRGSVYRHPKNEDKFFSKYLYELNQTGNQFFGVRDFFKEQSLPETREYIVKLLENGVFTDVADVLYQNLPEYALEIDKNTNQHERDVLIRNMTNLACKFGVFYAMDDIPGIYDSAEEILGFFKSKKYPWLLHWAPITAFVHRDHDPHGIWEYFTKALYTMKPDKPGKTIIDLQSISGVCFQTERWIFDFYDSTSGREDVDWLIKNILAVLYDKNFLAQKNPDNKYNPRKVRDVLELLLCVCRLKEIDATILDCNDPQTKDLVKQLKRIDADMRMKEEKGQLKYPFNSRLGINTPESYRRVNPVIYALIEILTGGNQVSLIGFSDTESAD